MPTPDESAISIRRRFVVRGIVQGVGFRPFVHQAATTLGLCGFVRNTDVGVVIEVEGRIDVVDRFDQVLTTDPPPLATIESVDHEELTLAGEAGFGILLSSESGSVTALVSPDLATCGACLAEVRNPDERRHRYPFTNCTNCGPRYTIVTDIPYDRPNTTMADFTMCAACGREYEDPTDRRFHAQPICCPACGPQMHLDGRDADPITETGRLLRTGSVVAVKGLGGYHLAALASSPEAIARLRSRKHREDKPFALMAADLAGVRALCELQPGEQDLLQSPARPVVLLRRRPDAALAPAVAPNTHELGVMLPYTPLHHLLLVEVGAPIVLTSGNLSDEPIAYSDQDARQRLVTVADHVLTHDREIHIRVDDSVVRVVDGAPYLIRRSRGYAPAPVGVKWPFPRPVLACGAELKNTVAMARDHHVFVSHHIGDLKNHETYLAFTEAIDHLGRLFDLRPAVVAHDLHPSYLSTAYADECEGVDRVAVQHHHAHIAACLADNGEAGPVIGVAFDGVGYGPDGTVWGGEFLVADLVDFNRVGWLDPVPLPGGDQAARQPWRMAAAYLNALGEAEAADIDLVKRQDQWASVVELARSGVQSPLTSSAGRLFDAVAALVGVRDDVTYEGQGAIELEQWVDHEERGAYEATITGDGSLVLAGADLVAGVLADLRQGVDPGRIAARFHRGLAQAVAAMCGRLRDARGLDTVALSGGVFLNVVLLRAVTELLEADGFRVLRHQRVPCNDGGISFGQAAVVGARDRRAR